MKGHGYSQMTPCVPTTGSFGRNIKNCESRRRKKKDFCIKNMGKEALNDYFSKI